MPQRPGARQREAERAVGRRAAWVFTARPTGSHRVHIGPPSGGPLPQQCRKYSKIRRISGRLIQYRTPLGFRSEPPRRGRRESSGKIARSNISRSWSVQVSSKMGAVMRRVGWEKSR